MAAAVIAVAWFALLVVQTHATNAASAIVASGRVTPAQGDHAAALLDTAARVNPDQTVGLLRSQLAEARGETSRARRLAMEVTRAEPDNAQAWLQLTRISAGPARVVAFRHLVRLVPPVKGGS